tara:strand:- start:166 stop:426 length:261 start_codon:yes stop_codon:yes gene_type:complete
MGKISKKSQEFRRMMAHRYEAAWHECFWELGEGIQVFIIEEPTGRHAQELAKATRILAEQDEWKPKKDYRAIPTDIKKLKKVNNEI